MTLGRAEATLIADVIDATQRALGRSLTREQMQPAVDYAAEVAVEAMRETERVAFKIIPPKPAPKRRRA